MIQPPVSRQTYTGFSLVELLIGLALIGVLATFTIPKLFQTPNSTLSGKYTAMSRDAAFMLVSAQEQWKMAGNTFVGCTSSLMDLTPYMNYVSIATSGSIDDRPDLGPVNGPLPCTAQYPCIKLHNGSVLQGVRNAYYYPGATPLSSIWIVFDPDGVYTGKWDSLHIALYADGSVRHRETVKSNTRVLFEGSCALVGKGPGAAGNTPSWFTGF